MIQRNKHNIYNDIGMQDINSSSIMKLLNYIKNEEPI